MSEASIAPTRADYGLDAPGVVRNLLLLGLAGLLLALGVWLNWLPPIVRWAPVQGFELVLPLFGFGFWPGIALTLTGFYMIWSSRVGKVLRRERLLDQLSWTGGEQVLDVGCGRGLFLIGAARRLTTGMATGVDIWRSEDLSGNSTAATLSNARIEGVAERVRVQTADMRELPFPEGQFDLVVSCAAVHNLSAAADRERAIQEMARVLKPGGHALIDDIRHFAQYRAAFATAGCPLVRRLDNRFESLFWTFFTWGSLQPGILLVRKGG